MGVINIELVGGTIKEFEVFPGSFYYKEVKERNISL